MKQIFKYNINEQAKLLKLRGKPISVINQHESLVLYAYYDARERERTYRVYTFGTGLPIQDDIVRKYQFLGTVSLFDGDLIWHIYFKEVSQ